MIDGLKPYPEYKDSGVAWLGEVPGHWELKRGKCFLRAVDVRSESGTEELLTVSSNRGVVPRRSANVTMFKAESYAGHKLCWSGDLVINSLWAWSGGLGVSQYHGIVSTAYGVYRAWDLAVVAPRFLHELVRSAPFHWELRVRSKGVWTSRLQLTDESFLGAIFPLPPLAEQAAIARFLDHADRWIRRYIRAKQTLIKLIEEQKQAVIHRAVTRGFDPNVRLKPSGLDWLGDVPEHWTLLQLRRLTAFVTSGSRGWAEYYSDEGDIFLQSGNLGRSMALNMSFTQRVRPPLGAEGERTQVEPDDVLVCITGALTGNVVHVKDDLMMPSFVNQHVALVRLKRSSVLPRYVAYALYSEVGRIQFKAGEYGGTKQGLGLDDVKSALVPVPPLSEQSLICVELDEAVSRIAASADGVQREIALLREYRTRLIADVVTGKLDVREAALLLPDEVEESEPPDEAESERDAAEGATEDLDALPEEFEA